MWSSTTPTPIRPSQSVPASIRTAEQHRQSRTDQGYAPKGSILNCEYPAPVAARHVVGMYVPMPILKALYHVMPDRVLAEGSGAVWTMQLQGKRADGRPFTSSMFNYSGGMGARATKIGPSATCYPTGVAAVPVEIVEAVTPVIFDRKELRPHSGGEGKMRAATARSSSSDSTPGTSGCSTWWRAASMRAPRGSAVEHPARPENSILMANRFTTSRSSP